MKDTTLRRTHNRIRKALSRDSYLAEVAFDDTKLALRQAGKGGLRQASIDLHSAADIIGEGRWLRGSWCEYHPCAGSHFCAEGAIFHVTGSSRTWATNPRAAIALAVADAMTQLGSIRRYNDASHRTARQVERKLREAARMASALAEVLPRNGSKALDTVSTSA